MIIVNICGGLGNQMFQYAFGRALSLHFDSDLKVDISWFSQISKKDTSREYNLSDFYKKPLIASDDEIKKIKGISKFLPKRIFNLLSRSNAWSISSYILETKYEYNTKIEKVKDNTYFEGYWQSYRYFHKYAEVIRNDFIDNYTLLSKNNRILQVIESHNTVSLHIRRGDYVSNPHANSYHGVSPLEYYYKALQYISGKIKHPYCIVFSDDIQWVKDNLKTTIPLIFAETKEDDKPFDDMYLMSLCQHNIIANSSFSWWGAYLNNSPEKIVIAPKKWFIDTSKNTNDLIPNNWVRL